ncbi:7TM-DISM domain-containing protein [Limnohabitans sp.]|jgi:signal transduction histidine kinase|uniref:7TM-DISM domain-containing protein n=1 Tax=Limnohabitans sp. TaxID=1907725 RepID=UPI002897B6BE|nr:7TM-DISM domain-containing protein [Limnohabitans sp.]
MKRLLCLLLLLFFQVFVHAGAGAYRVDTAYHHSDTPTHTINDVQSLAFTPYEGALRLGFTKGDTWVRLQIQALQARTGTGQDGPEPATVLRVGPYFLDDLTFYQQQGGRWVEQQGGDRHVKQTQNCPDDLYCFGLTGFDGAATTVYLKVQTTSVRMVQTTVMAADEVIPSAIVRIRRMTVSLTLAAALLVLSLAFFVVERSSLLHLFCWFQAVVILSIAATTGLLAQWLPFLSAETRNDLGNMAQVVRVAFMVLLGWVVIKPCKPVTAYRAAVVLMLAVCGVNLFGVLTEHAVWALKINAIVLWLNTLALVMGVWSARQIAPKLRKILLASFLIFLLFVSLGLYASLGLVWWRDHMGLFQSIADWRLNGVPIGIVVFWIVATEKSNRKIQKLQELQGLQIEAAQSKAHQEKLKERRDLIDMLTHELKTPLGTIKFALASLKRTAKSQGESLERVQHIDASVNRMDAMIEHVALSNKIERHDAHDSAETISAQELMNVVMQEYRDEDRFDVRIQDGASFHADPHFLALIVENLVSNAVKYAADGKIRISITNETPSETCFRISNRVAEGSLPDETRLFERYYRHPNFQNHPGMGIGLSLVHSAAEKMGATVHYQKVDREVFFEVRMPC